MQSYKIQLESAEKDVEDTKMRMQHKLRTLTQTIRHTINFKRLLKRNEKSEKSGGGPSMKLQTPFIVVKY